jgi:hypothetical protein
MALQRSEQMTRANKALVVMVVATLGLWGCAQGQSGGTAGARIRELESRTAKLEEDYRAAVAARDLARKRLAVAEEQKNQLAQKAEQLPALKRERDELRIQVSARISERDSVQAQYDQFRKTIRNLLGQADAAALKGTASQPVTSAAQRPAAFLLSWCPTASPRCR